MLAFPHMFDLLTHKLARGGRWRFALTEVFFCLFNGLFFWHGLTPIGLIN